MKNFNYKNAVSVLLFISVIAVTLTQITFAESADRTRFETGLVNPSTNKDDGHARFEERPDRRLLTVEMENQNANSSFNIKIDGVVAGSITSDSGGFAGVELDSRKGDNIPSVKSGSKIEIISSGNVILTGIFGGQTGGSVPTTIPGTTPTVTTPGVSTTSVTIPLGAKDKTVTEFFSPRVIQVNQFDTVTWTNKDNTAHTVTGSSFDSGLIAPGQTFSQKFNENGTFDYACQLHSWMTGQVVVGTGGPIASPPSTPPAPIPTPIPTPPSSTTSQNKVSIPAGAADKKVTEFFVPKSLRVKVNDGVTWTNNDSVIHTITSGTGTKDGTFDSGFIGAGKSFSFTFTKSGTFDYFCQVHPWMTGQITVSNDTSIAPSQAALPGKIQPILPIPSPPLISPSAQSTSSVPSTSKVSIPSGAADKKVTEYFVPKIATVKIQDSVTWTNDDSAAHTVTSGFSNKGGDGMFDSSILSVGKSFTFKFTKAGTVDYFCMVHPWMAGQIIVKEGTAPVKITSMSPLKQIKSGVAPKDVECRSELNLAVKATDGSPVCVKPQSIEKLLLWGFVNRI